LSQLQKLRSDRSEDYNEYQLTKEIIKLFEKCIELNPENPTTYIQYADFYLQQNDYNNALNKINQGMNSKFDISLLHMRSQINQQKSDYLNSATDYRLIAEYYENSKSSKETIAYYYFQAGYQFTNSHNYQEGINAFDKGFKFNNKDANSYNNRGVCYENLGKLDMALKDYNMSISMGKNDQNLALFIRNSGILLYKLNRKSEACEQLKKAMNLDSKYLYDYNSYCNSNYRRGK
jgi:tetratricopeptide (TPR) repeat protein